MVLATYSRICIIRHRLHPWHPLAVSVCRCLRWRITLENVYRPISSQGHSYLGKLMILSVIPCFCYSYLSISIQIIPNIVYIRFIRSTLACMHFMWDRISQSEGGLNVETILPWSKPRLFPKFQLAVLLTSWRLENLTRFAVVGIPFLPSFLFAEGKLGMSINPPCLKLEESPRSVPFSPSSLGELFPWGEADTCPARSVVHSLRSVTSMSSVWLCASHLATIYPEEWRHWIIINIMLTILI